MERMFILGTSPMLKKALNKTPKISTSQRKKRIWIKPKIGDKNEI
jgi:hypothetical protein